MTYCSYCYKDEAIGSCLSKCGNCRKRLYCSKEYQVQDWRTGHKIYCGVAGEIGVDFEIQSAGESKGHGTFALRDFEENEKIMMEWPILFNPNGSTLAGPRHCKGQGQWSRSQGRFARNSMSCSDDGGSTVAAFLLPCPTSTTIAWATATITSILVEVSKFSSHQKEFLVKKKLPFSYGASKLSAERKQILQRQYKLSSRAFAPPVKTLAKRTT